ncbi:MAG: serpin family protein [Bacteroidales bacterium]|nr:serpin family protein [Bacteroidales bacterium]
MKHFGLLAATALLLTVGLSCEKQPGSDSRNNPYKALDLTTKSAELATKGNTFAFEFIDQVNAAEKGDFIISPLSMQFLLGMLLDGAQNGTADEICKVLGYGAGEVGAVNEYCLAMLEQLPSLDKVTKLSIANAIFVNKMCSLKDSYKSTVGKYYQAEVSNLDFSDGAGSLKTINGWCNKQTNGMIPKVLNSVSSDMLAYLLNAMYFKSEWKEKFPKSNTASETFTAENGATKKVPMMKNEKEFYYQDNDDFRVVKLPYGNRAFNMLVILPQSGKTLAQVTAALKTCDWTNFIRRLVRCEVDLWLPRFETKYSKQLNEILSDMGMPSAFSGSAADFKAMSDAALCLSFVKQDALIKVDEEGTEAAAVSTAGIKETSAGPGQHIVFHADRPFLYLITESSTNAILFAGKYCGK